LHVRHKVLLTIRSLTQALRFRYKYEPSRNNHQVWNCM